MNAYKVEWSYLDSSKKRLYKTDLFFVSKVSDAIKKIQAEYDEYKELRIEDVWQDSGYSWDSVNRCFWG